MTDNEIIKALECCIDVCDGKSCHLCSLYDDAHCQDVLLIKAIDLIKRQKAEIERLNDEKENLRCVIDDLCNNTEYAKSEAMKEFAERLNDKVFKINYCGSVYNVVDKDDIDDLVTEMVVKI